MAKTKKKAAAANKKAAKKAKKPVAKKAKEASKSKKTPAKKAAPKKVAKASPAKKPQSKPAAKKAVVKPPTPPKAPPPAPAQSKEKEKPVVKADKPRKKLPFSVNDFVVYPTHGVGRITAIERQEISGIDLEMFVVEFDKDKMILRVPTAKVDTSGMRKLASPKVMDEAMTTLKGRARVKRTMWSRRAQEYEAKINSGDPIAIAEVVRDLHRNANQPEQSYSERQIYEAALDRLVREVAAVEKIDEDAAQERLQKVLQAA